MHVSDEYVPVLGRSMTVRRPDGPTRGGVVALHGATSPERDQPLFGHLADTLTPLAVEAVLRGEGDRDELAALLDAGTREPWWPLAWLPDHVPAPGGWADMDFDPEPTFARVTCPTLLMYGEDEENVPAAPSIAVWRRASPADLTVETIARCGHFPSPDGGQRRSDIASAYGDVLAAWF